MKYHVLLGGCFLGALISFQDGTKKAIPDEKEEAESILYNGSFEEGIGSYIADLRSFKWDLNNWAVSYSQVAGTKFQLDSEQHVEGKKSAMLQNLNSSVTEPLYLAEQISKERFSKQIGRDMKFTASIKSQSISFADVRVEGLDSRGRTIAAMSVTGGGVRGTQEWKKYEVPIIIPQDAVTLTVRCYMQGSGTVWFDDLKLAIVPLSESKSAAAKIQDFRQKLSQYIRAQEGKEEKQFRKALEGYRSVSIEALILALQKGFQYDRKPGGETQALTYRGRGSSGRVTVTMPQSYDVEKQYVLLIDLSAAAAEGGDPWIEQAGATDVFVAHLPADASGAQNPIALGDIVVDVAREIRKHYAVDPEKVILCGQGAAGSQAMGAVLTHPGEFAGAIAIRPDHFPTEALMANAAMAPCFVLMTTEEREAQAEKIAAITQRGAKLTVQEFESFKNPFAASGPDLIAWARKAKRESLPSQIQESIYAGREAGTYTVQVAAFAGKDAPEGVAARLRLAVSGNEIELNAEGAKKIRIGIDPRQFDIERNLIVRNGGKTLFDGRAQADFDFFLDEIRRKADFRRIAIAEIEFGL